jgi:hypothetical protein
MRMNPFDIRTVVLAKHAQHVVLIHFPIALLSRPWPSITSHAVDEESESGRGRAFQSAATRGVDCASRGDWFCRVAMSA